MSLGRGYIQRLQDFINKLLVFSKEVKDNKFPHFFNSTYASSRATHVHTTFLTNYMNNSVYDLNTSLRQKTKLDCWLVLTITRAQLVKCAYLHDSKYTSSRHLERRRYFILRPHTALYVLYLRARIKDSHFAVFRTPLYRDFTKYWKPYKKLYGHHLSH